MLPPLIAPAAHLTARPRQDFDVSQIKVIAKLRDAWPRRIYSSPSALADGRTAREAEYCLPMDDSELHSLRPARFLRPKMAGRISS
jgi:hypothetical protein